MKDLDKPVNITERYMYAIAVRLDAIIEMLSSFIQHYAEQNKIALTSHKVSEVKVTPAPRKKKKGDADE